MENDTMPNSDSQASNRMRKNIQAAGQPHASVS